MSAPLAKGIIIATSLLLAAGFAIYENDQVRQWVEQQRRKIFVAMNGGDPFGEQQGVHRGRHRDATASQDGEQDLRDRNVDRMATQLRDEMIRQHRQEIFRRAREEGVAVDLDELKAVEEIFDRQQALLDEAARNKKDRDIYAGVERRQSAQTFDELVGADGRLREEQDVGNATGSDMSSQGLRHRATASAFDRGASYGANPFDDGSETLFDQALIGAGGEKLASLLQTPSSGQRASTPKPRYRKINIPVQDGRAVSEEEDVLATPYKTEQELNDEIQEAIRRSLEDVTISSTLENYASAHVMEEPSLLDQRSEEEQHELVQSVRSDSESLPLLSIRDQEQSTSFAPSMQNSIYESYYYGQPRSSSATIRDTPFNDQTRSMASFHSAVADQLSSLRHTPTVNQTQAQQTQSQQPMTAGEEDDNTDSDWDDAFTPTGTLTPTEDNLSITDGISELDYNGQKAENDVSGSESSLYRDDGITEVQKRSPPASHLLQPQSHNQNHTTGATTITQLTTSRQRSRASSIAFSEFSDVGDAPQSGTMTPASWTDVDSVVSGDEDQFRVALGSAPVVDDGRLTEEERRRRERRGGSLLPS